MMDDGDSDGDRRFSRGMTGWERLDVARRAREGNGGHRGGKYIEPEL